KRIAVGDALTEQEPPDAVLREPVCEKTANYSRMPRRRFSRQGFGPRYRTPGEPAIRLDQYRADLTDPRDDQNIGIDKRSAGCRPVAATVAVAATNELRDEIINFNTLNRQSKCMFLDKPSCSSAIIVQPRLCPLRPPPQSPGVLYSSNLGLRLLQPMSFCDLSTGRSQRCETGCARATVGH